MSRALQLAAGLVISAVCLWFSMRDVDPVAVGRVLRHANYAGFMAAVATTLFAFWLRARHECTCLLSSSMRTSASWSSTKTWWLYSITVGAAHNSRTGFVRWRFRAVATSIEASLSSATRSDTI